MGCESIPFNSNLVPATWLRSSSTKMEGANNSPSLPEWIRLPRSGEKEFYTGLSRSALNALILRTKQNPKPPVRSISLKDPHQVRGIRLIKLASLLAHLDSLDDGQRE